MKHLEESIPVQYVIGNSYIAILGIKDNLQSGKSSNLQANSMSTPEMKWFLEMKRFSKVIIALSLALRVEVTLG